MSRERADLEALADRPLRGLPLTEKESELIAADPKTYARYVPGADERTESRVELARFSRQMGWIHQQLGNAQLAKRAYSLAVSLYEQLAAEFPDETDYPFRQALILGPLSRNRARLGYSDEALQLGGRAIEILERLRADYPDAPKFGIAAAWMYTHFAVTMREVRPAAEIEQDLRTAIDWFQRYAEDLPDGQLPEEFPYRDLQDGLAYSQMHAGRLRVALDYFEDAVTRAPLSAWHGRQLAKASQLLGQKNADEAAARRGYEVVQRLYEEFPGVPEHRALLARSATDLGVLLLKRGKDSEAEPPLRSAVQLMTALVDEIPGVPDFQSELAAMLHNLSTLSPRLMKPAEARSLLQLAIEHQLKALQSNPAHRRYWTYLANHYGNLAIVLRKLKNQEQPPDPVARKLLLSDELAARVPAESLNKLLDKQHDLALGLSDLGQSHEAEQIYRQLIAAYERAIEERGGDAENQSWLAAAQNNLAKLLLGRGELMDGEDLVRDAIRHQRAALEVAPNHPRYKEFLSNHYSVLSNLLQAKGAWEAVIELHQKGIGLQPDHACGYNRLAWLLATCRDPQFRDVSRATELATKATTLPPQHGSHWNTLGVAWYRAADYGRAIEALEKSLQLGDGSAHDFFFLAMAHWQLAARETAVDAVRLHEVDARQWYQRAVAWMRGNLPDDEELLRFRAEAEKLMGMDEEQTVSQ